MTQETLNILNFLSENDISDIPNFLLDLDYKSIENLTYTVDGDEMTFEYKLYNNGKYIATCEFDYMSLKTFEIYQRVGYGSNWKALNRKTFKINDIQGITEYIDYLDTI